MRKVLKLNNKFNIITKSKNNKEIQIDQKSPHSSEKNRKKVSFFVFTHSLSPWCFIRRTKPGEHGAFIFFVNLFHSSSRENGFYQSFLESMQEKTYVLFLFLLFFHNDKKTIFFLNQIYELKLGVPVKTRKTRFDLLLKN